MAVETVRVAVVDQDDEPVVGVLVRVFDETGTTFITQDSTVLVGGNAIVDFTLDGDTPPISYTIRLSKTGVAFDGTEGDDNKSPQLIDIYSPPTEAPNDSNDFLVVAQTFTMPVATDPRLCRCSGYFKDASGRALPGLDIQLINQFKPALVDGYAVMGAKLDLRTDDDGYVEVDLYRTGIYHAMVESMQAAESSDTGAIVMDRDVTVPDRSSANLIDLLFPVVKSIVWDPATVAVGVGNTVDVVPTATASDYRVLAGAAIEDVLYEIADTTIANVAPTVDKLTITGIKAGTTTLVATRKDQTIVTVPVVDITGSPLTVTVG
jgi:hypothetical protein